LEKHIQRWQCIIKVPDKVVIFHITDKEIFESITKKRLELISIIKKKAPKSIVELAKLANRTKQSVNRDLKLLEKNALVSLEKKGKTVAPIVEKDAMVLSFTGAKQIEA
jgi:predicted transcriptional regulator